MWKFCLSLEKYWVTCSVHFKLATKDTLDVGMTDGNILFYHVISEQSREKKFSIREYNYRTDYGCFNYPFLVVCVIQYLILLPITIYDSFILNKISQYTPDPIPDAIYVASGNSIITFTTHYESPKVSLVPYYASYTYHIIMRDKPGHATDKIVYYSRQHDVILCYKKSKLYYLRVILIRGVIIFWGIIE